MPQGVTTIGFQVKPIVPINYFGAGPIEPTSDSAIINISSKMGYSWNGIRRGLTKPSPLKPELIIPEEILNLLVHLHLKTQVMLEILVSLAMKFLSKA